MSEARRWLWQTTDVRRWAKSHSVHSPVPSVANARYAASVRWTLLLTIASLVGVLIGLGSFTFVYAEGHSYLRDDPKVCANCHVMQDQLDAWRKSSHREVAVCNDCHTPHTGIFAKYATKATNGFWHSFYFTTGTFPDPIRIRPKNRAVTEGTCRACHAAVAESMIDDGEACTRCHADVGHWTR